MTMRHNIDAKKTMPILCLAFMLSLAPCSYAQLPAPTSVSISEVAHTSFEVTFDDVSGASSYQVTTTAMHDPSDTVTTSTSGLSLTVTDRRSNINYEVAVRALDASSQLGDSSSAITARTAPGGSSVFYAITTPTFITVFLEETPGATAWEIEYTNSVTSETNSLEVPAGTPSNTLYVAIIQPLNPNTEYRIRVRVSQINLATNYDVTQSPYGESINYTTDRLSAFGRIELITRSYSAGDNDDETLKNEIATELQAAYRSVSSDVFSVSVVQLEQYPGTTNTLCHYEILLNDRSSSPDVTAIAIDDSTLYRNQTVLYDASSRLGDYKLEENPSRTTLSYQDGTHCDTRTLATDTRIWTLFDKTGEIQSAEVDGANPTPADLIFFEFSDSDIKSSSDTIFTLSPNSIYGIKQNYLLKTCISSDGDVTIYDRQYGAFSENTRPPSNRYTIFHSTGLANLNTSIDFSTDIDGTGVTLRIPSTFASRATLYQFTVDGTAHPSLTLNEEDLDSSEFYLVPISGLTADVVSTISVTVTARADDSFNSSDFITVDVTPDVNECLSTVIPNNCNINAECMNNIGSFSCSCNDGYAGNGTFCTDINECTSIETPHDCDGNAICSNTEGAFNCTCNPGYTGDGKTCADVDECISTAATHNCNVNARCSNTPGNYTCTCNSGFVGDGESCEDINECTDTENPHNCDGKAFCTNTIGRFTCTCNAGFKGNGTTCSDINECTSLENPHNCDRNASCTNTAGNFTCKCNSGYTGDGNSCSDIDECTSLQNLHNCDRNASCINTAGNFTCECNSGYTGDGNSCSDIDECTSLENPHNCDRHASCINTAGNFTCECNSGYTGDGNSCSDVDECTSLDNPHNCDRNASCINTAGNFTCECNSGYTGDGNSCSDIDECTSLDNPHNCDRNASCINTAGNFTCECNSGYTGDGNSCSDVDECTSLQNLHNCDRNASCINTAGNFTCKCNSGYTGDGNSCSDVDECTSLDNPHNCDRNASCINTAGNFTCECNSGYTGNGNSCSDIDECTSLNNPHNCDRNASCINTAGNFTCKCNSGYTGDGNSCSDIDECTSLDNPHNCDRNASCINTAGNFTCECNSGYTGDGNSCSDIDECTSLENLPNCDRNTSCKNTAGNFTCECNSGYIGDGTTCVDEDECALDTHGCNTTISNCTNADGSYTCSCFSGYLSEGLDCVDEDECESNSTICGGSKVCRNTAGSFECVCNEGFVVDGTTCSDINECTDSVNVHNCHSEANCINVEGGFECICKLGFIGNGVTCSGTPDNSWILLVVILSLTGLVVLLTGVLIYRYYTRHNGTRKSYDLEKARRKQNFVTEIDKDKSQIRNFFFFGKKGLYKVTDYDKQEQDRYRLFNQTGNYDVTRDQAAPPKGKKQSNKKSPRHQKGFYDLEKARQKSKQETKDHSKRLNIFGFYRQKGTDNFFAILYDRSSSTNEGIRSDNPSMLQAERRLGEFDDLAVVPDRPPIQKPVGMINRAYLPSESENLQETSFNTSDNFPDRSSTGYSSSPSNVEEDCCRDDASDTPSKDTSPISSSGDEHGKGNYNLRGAQNDFDKEKKQKSKRKGSQGWFNHKGKYDLQNAEEDFYKRKERPSKKDKAQSKKGSYDVREAETKIGLHDVPSAGAIHVSDVRIESRDSARGVEGIANQSFVDSDQDATSNATDAKASSTVSSVPSTAKRRNGSTNSSFSSGDEHARGTYDFTKAQKEFDKEKKKKSKRKGSQRWFKHGFELERQVTRLRVFSSPKGKYDLRDAEEEFVKNEERQSRSEDNSPAKTGNYDVHGAEVEFGIRRDTTEKEDTSRVISVSDKPLEPNGGQNREGFSNSAYEGQDPDSPDQS